jgi:23S rRNA (uracil1939-C5)-methyltransferase
LIEIIGGANIKDIVLRQQATYQEIQKWVEQHHGFQPKTGWIAHCKELQGVPLREAANRRGTERLDPCPPDKRTAIIQAFRHFGMVP